MEFVRLFGVYVYIIIILISTVNSQQTLISPPEDAQVRIGSDVVFRCKATYANYYTLFWKHGNWYLTRGYQLYSSVSASKYSVSFQSSFYHLTISNIQLSDAGSYECRFGYKNEHYAHSFQPTATATLTVHQPPSEISPRCSLYYSNTWVLPETPLYIGELIIFDCFSEDHGSTSPNLTITVSDISVAEHIVMDNIDYKWVKSDNIIIERKDTELTCYLDSVALDETRKCTIRLNVFLPDVEIKPKLQSVQETDDVHFICFARNFKTPNIQYEWQVSPYLPGSIVNSMTSILNIANLQLDKTLNENQLFTITCFVQENGIVWSSSTTLTITRLINNNLPTTNPTTAKIVVNQPPSVTSPKCLLSRNNTRILSEKFYIGEPIIFYCYSEGHGSTSPNLTITVSDVSVAGNIVRDVIDLKWVKSNEITIIRNDTDITCYLDSEALDETRNCTIRLNVLSPDMEIKPKVLSVQETDAVHFHCSARNLKTNNFQYEWQVSPYIPGDIFTFKTSILNITDLKLNNTLLGNQLFIITCFVIEDGMVRNSSTTLTITRREINILPTTLLNNDQDFNSKNDNSELYIVSLIIGTVTVAIAVVILLIVVLNRKKVCIILCSNKSNKSETRVNDTPLYAVVVKKRNRMTTNVDEGGEPCDNVSVPNQNDLNTCDIICNTQDNDDENRYFTQETKEMLNAEGLNYAELDLRKFTSCDIIDTEQSVTYATLQT